MKRDLIKRLIAWKEDKDRLPLLIRGARQIGKTHLIREFGKHHFAHFFEINFELHPEYADFFITPDPRQIINAIKLTTSTPFIEGKTLLFLDEIQICPKAILALRYFYEKMGNLHVLAAGSLLEFTLNDPSFQMPVGRVQYLFMKPFSFTEFLSAKGLDSLKNNLSEITLSSPLPIAVHNHLLQLVCEYSLLGGMPKSIDTYLFTQDLSKVQDRQTAILTTYRDDFGKYAKRFPHHYLHTLFQRTPRLIGKQFSYKDIDPELRSREIKRALALLKQAGVLHVSHAVSCSGIPLSASIREKKYKVFFLDIGLIMCNLGLDPHLLLQKDLILINRGALAEQFTAQELLAYHSPTQPPELFWWHRDKQGSEAEIDFVTTFQDSIIPIEVKAGSTGRLRSVKIFMEEKKAPLGVRICSEPLSFENQILTIPFYLISQVHRLLGEHLV